jgi:hypothetical protein
MQQRTQPEDLPTLEREREKNMERQSRDSNASQEAKLAAAQERKKEAAETAKQRWKLHSAMYFCYIWLCDLYLFIVFLVFLISKITFSSSLKHVSVRPSFHVSIITNRKKVAAEAASMKRAEEIAAMKARREAAAQAKRVLCCWLHNMIIYDGLIQ